MGVGSLVGHRARFALVAVTALWGATFTLTDLALKTASPGLLLALRFSAAALVLWAFVAVARRGRVTRQEAIWGCLAGALLYAGYLTQADAQQLISPSLTAFLTGLSVLLVPVLLRIVGRPLTRAETLGVAGCVIGLVALTDPGGRVSLGGVTLAVGCAVAFAAQMVLLERGPGHLSPLRLVTVEMTVCAAAGIATLPFSPSHDPLLAQPTIFWVAVAVNGVGASALAFWIQARSLASLSSVEISVIYSLEPVFAAIVALSVLGAHLTPLAWCGGGVVVGASLYMGISGSPPAHSQTATEE